MMAAELSDMSLVPSADEVPVVVGGEPSGLTVRVTAEGHLQVEGERAEVQAFLEACAQLGMVIELDYLSWCG